MLIFWLTKGNTLRPFTKWNRLNSKIRTPSHFPTQITQVSDSHPFLANQPFTKWDFHQALKDLKKNKSPGSDSLTPEYILAFWDVLEDAFYGSITFFLQNHCWM